ncbi:hypothetical protein AD943_10245 [Gluconobacter roseus]|nr:hypothetical protein AD943_10245 [Gluconobacter roseus]GBR42465.1 hypothetical protein AA3990_0096 [Gluconobacter roseus NBRC 3990]
MVAVASDPFRIGTFESPTDLDWPENMAVAVGQGFERFHHYRHKIQSAFISLLLPDDCLFPTEIHVLPFKVQRFGHPDACSDQERQQRLQVRSGCIDQAPDLGLIFGRLRSDAAQHMAQPDIFSREPG